MVAHAMHFAGARGLGRAPGRHPAFHAMPQRSPRRSSIVDAISRRGSPRRRSDPESRCAMQARLPSRLHHTAYVAVDLEKTRAFYEDVIGLPLVATWCESDELFGEVRTYCHCFFGLEDGSARAFFL